MFYPSAKRRGDELKEVLIRAGACGDGRNPHGLPAGPVRADGSGDPRRRKEDTPAASTGSAENYRLAQFEAFDMLAAEDELRLGGAATSGLDILGLNYYFHNQWRHPSRQRSNAGILNTGRCTSISRISRALWPADLDCRNRHRGRPACRLVKLHVNETQASISLGVAINGICLYPIVNHPGWADARHCHNGLWDYADDEGDRPIHEPLAAAVREFACQMVPLTRPTSAGTITVP